MESIEKLRKYQLYYRTDEYTAFVQLGNVLADEIEREIAERYMELPVDADGVPIRVGDVVESYGEKFNVRGICENSLGRLCVQGGKHNAKIAPYDCRHVNPRTLEDVLRELVECAEMPGGKLDDGDIEGFAADIRELLGVDA